MRLFLISIFIVMVAVFSVGVHPRMEQKATALLLKDIAPFVSPVHVSVGAVSYSVDDEYRIVRMDGRPLSPRERAHVLRLTYASIRTRIDPLLSFEGSSPEALRGVVPTLQDSSMSIQSAYGTAYSAFYPTVVLLALADAEESRTELIKLPTAHGLRSYIRDTNALVRALRAHARDTAHMYRDIIPGKDSAVEWRYGFVGGSATNVSFFVFIDEIRAELEVVSDALAQRTKCVGAPTRETCRLAYRLTIPKSTYAVSRVSPHAQENATLLANVYARAGRATIDTQTLAYLDTPFCFPERSGGTYLMLDSIETRPGLTKTMFVDELYFFDARNADDAHLRLVAQKGFDFFFQPPTNTYLCPLDTWDSMRMLTARAIRHELQHKPLARGSMLAELEVLETRILEDEVLNVPVIDTYIALIAQLARDEHALQAHIGREGVFFAQQLIRMHQSQSADMARLFALLADENKFVIRSARNNITIPYHDVIVSRTAPLLAFFTHNATVYKTAPRLILRHNSDFASLQLTTYEENAVLRAKVPPAMREDALLHAMQFENTL